MPQDISPAYFADQFLEQITSSSVGFKAGNTVVFPAGVLTNATAAGVTLAGRRVPVLPGSTAANLTLTDAMSGSTLDIDGATQAWVLPALTSLNSGADGIYFDFVVSLASTTVTITAGSGDLLTGGVDIMSTSAGVENDAFSANGSSDLIVTMNGTTKGGLPGSELRFRAASATKWLVTGTLLGSGTIVTPFS